MELLVKNLSKKYGEKEVLKGISFGVKSGSSLGLLGRNGAGKTTTIRILLGLIKADYGDIYFDREKIRYHNIKIGYLPEERGLYSKQTVYSQLIYFAELKGLKRKEAEQRVKWWLKRLEIEEYCDKQLDSLSKGNQQKVQLITALVHNPDIVILDEPFSGLDPVNSLILKDVIREEQENGKLILFSSHQMNYIEEFCDEIAIVNQGKISLSGNIREIKKKYSSNRIIVKSPYNNQILTDYSSNSFIYKKESVIIEIDEMNDRKRIMGELIEKYDVKELKVFEPELDDIFIEYTTGV